MLMACGGSSGAGTVDSGMVVAADAGTVGDAGVTRYCTKPTSGTYGFTHSVGGSALYLIGADGWSVKIGNLVAGPSATPISLEAVGQQGTSLVGTAGKFMYDIPKTANSAGRVVIEPRNNYVASTSLATLDYFDQTTFVASHDRDVICGTSTGGTFILGLGSTLPCTTISGIHGTCSPATKGNYEVKAVVSCNGTSRYVEMSQINMMPMQNFISNEITGTFHGLTSDSRSTDGTGKVFSIGRDGATKLLDLKLCVDEFLDNSFNGSTISISEIVD